jgi:hypothetical protein
VSKQRLETEMCPVTRAPVTKSATTRTWESQLLKEHEDRRFENVERTRTDKLHAVRPVKKPSFKTTRPSKPVNQKAAARIGHARVLRSRVRIEYEAQPSGQAITQTSTDRPTVTTITATATGARMICARIRLAESARSPSRFFSNERHLCMILFFLRGLSRLVTRLPASLLLS